jgi:hypothetical protein
VYKLAQRDRARRGEIYAEGIEHAYYKERTMERRGIVETNK